MSFLDKIVYDRKKGNAYIVKRTLPMDRVKIKNDGDLDLLRQFYHVEHVMKFDNHYWFVNKIEDIEYEEI